ncbi:MAG: TraR/DksA family transcriptional regulator, partial [Casimicrobiaceae bacterium]
LREQFKERRRALLQEVRESLESADSQKYAEILGREPGDAGDASVSDMLADLNLTLLDRHVAELRAIEAAEARIADGTYGECSECGGDIGFERLLAMPTAVRCVRCQELYEKTHATPATPSL